jgi:hypothetical protein
MLPYNLIKTYPTSDWERDIIKDMLIHNDDETWKYLSKFGIKYKQTKDNKYFPTNIEIIGMGSFSVIYKITGTKYVLKITNNIYEVDWSEQLEGLQKYSPDKEIYLKNYVNIIDGTDSEIVTPIFTSDYDDKYKVSFIILEELFSLSLDEIDNVGQLNNYYSELYGDEFYDEYLDIDSLTEFRNLNLINEKFDNKYIILIDKIIQLANDIEEFNWKDFHLKNLMKDANENWKIIDLQQWFG